MEDLSPDVPTLLIANEWLDCLPVQQYVRVGEAWHERVVGLGDDGALKFGLNVTPLPPGIDLGMAQDALEMQPGLKTLIGSSLKPVFEAVPARALFIDYGPPNAVPG